VLDLLEEFSKYNLSVIPKGKNQITDSLATSASVFKIPMFPNRKYEIEVQHRPAMPNNIKYWQVFEDDKQVERFLQMSDEFANMNIDDEYCCEDDENAVERSDNDPFQNQIAGRDIVQLKNNIIPKGLVPFERLFDENDVARNPRITANDGDIKDCNIRTQENPKIIRLLKTLSPEIKQRYINLIKYFPHIFAWSYEDLKVYDTRVI
jgi:hypothetical protein